MSKENVKQLFGKMEKDAELQKKYTALIQEHHKETEKILSGKLLEFGKTAGFEFSMEDLFAARAEFIDKNHSGKELSDSDMGSVAGGITQKQIGIITSAVTLGLGCAAMSLAAEFTRPNKGACQSYFSGTDNNCNNHKK